MSFGWSGYGIELSKSSDVLSMFTSFVGYSESRTQSSGWHVGCDICVKTLTGQCFSIDGCTSVKELKDRFQDCQGIPADQIRLVAAWRQLDDDPYPPVMETVHLNLVLRGGDGGMSMPSNPMRELTVL